MRIVMHILFHSCVFCRDEFCGAPLGRASVGDSGLDYGLSLESGTDPDIPIILRFCVYLWIPGTSVDRDGLIVAHIVCLTLVEGREGAKESGCECLHSGSFPSSMAMRFLILSLATFAAAMVLVMLSWPRLRPSTYQSWLKSCGSAW
jgi:hypothetical protein